MKLALVLCATLAAVAVASKGDWLEFQAWRSAHGRVYRTSDELVSRFATYVNNKRTVSEHNKAPGNTYRLALNQFADLTPAEFVKQMSSNDTLVMARRLGTRFAGNSPKSLVPPKGGLGALPRRVDWQKAGFVGPVPNQGQCGGIAPVVADTIAATLATRVGKFVSLSTQELEDCAGGCVGGSVATVTSWLEHHGLCTAASYPTTGSPGACHASECTPAAHVTGATDVPESDIGLETAIFNSPVLVGIDATSLQFYEGGVFNGASCGTSINHVMLAVGYGDSYTGSEKYWRAQNSWGDAWGEQGYIRFAKGTQYNPAGICGIQSAATAFAVSD